MRVFGYIFVLVLLVSMILSGLACNKTVYITVTPTPTATLTSSLEPTPSPIPSHTPPPSTLYAPMPGITPTLSAPPSTSMAGPTPKTNVSPANVTGQPGYGKTPILILESGQPGRVTALWDYKGGGLTQIYAMPNFVLRNIGDPGDLKLVLHPLINGARYQFVEGDLSTTIHMEKDDCLSVSYTLQKAASSTGSHVLQGVIKQSVDEPGKISVYVDFFGAFLWNYDGSLKVDFDVEMETDCPLIKLSTYFSDLVIYDSYNGSCRVQANVTGLNTVDSVIFSYTFSGWSKDPSALLWSYYATWSDWEKASGRNGNMFYYDIPRSVWINHVGEEVECKAQVWVGDDTKYERTAFGRIEDDDIIGPQLSNPWSTGDVDYSYTGNYRIQITAFDASGIGAVSFRYWLGNEPPSDSVRYSGSSGFNYWYDIPRDVWHTLEHAGDTVYFQVESLDADNDGPNDQEYDSCYLTFSGGTIKLGGITLINENRPGDYMNIGTNGTFYLREGGADFTGTWMIWNSVPKQIAFSMDSVGVVYSRVNGNTLVDPTGDIWVEK